jgi:hypothetical protein
MDDTGKVQTGDTDILHIRVKEFEKEVGHLGLLSVLHTDTEFIGIIGGQVQRQAVVVSHSLNEFE